MATQPQLVDVASAPNRRGERSATLTNDTIRLRLTKALKENARRRSMTVESYIYDFAEADWIPPAAAPEPRSEYQSRKWKSPTVPNGTSEDTHRRRTTEKVRRQIIAAVEEGNLTITAIASRYSVATATVRRIVQEANA
jgi:hypothetical protein